MCFRLGKCMFHVVEHLVLGLELEEEVDQVQVQLHPLDFWL